jgi:ribosomal-protein-alanine N-acetyltransferase
MGSNPPPGAASLNRVVVRPATGADLADVVALEQLCYGDPWPRSAFSSLPANPQVFFNIARDAEGRLAGYVVGWYVLDEGELANLAVAPDRRSQGIGRLLLEAILQDAGKRGTRQLYLEVRRSNTTARQLYLSNGFEEVGLRKRYYRMPTEDALILRRTLNG